MKSRKILAAVLASACAISATTAISFAAAEGGLGGDAQDYVKTVNFDKPDGTYFVPSGANEYGSLDLAGLRVLLDHDTLDLSTIESISFKGAAGAVYTKAHEGTCEAVGNDHETGGWANPTDGVVVLKMSDLDLGGWFSIKPVATTEGAEVEITVTFKSAAGDNNSNPTESEPTESESEPTESESEPTESESEPTGSDSESETENSSDAGNSGASGDNTNNPGTGIALAVVPVVIAGAAIAVAAKKRK